MAIQKWFKISYSKIVFTSEYELIFLSRLNFLGRNVFQNATQIKNIENGKCPKENQIREI